jgi:TFIIF-interacting CTD phosphatase-like protein
MQRKNIILDLDQTLISAEPTQDFSSPPKTEFTMHNMEDYYYICERPFLQDFLTYIFANYNVSVWTAASKDYALFIIDKIILKNDKNRKIDWIFFSYHCKISEKKKDGSKELSTIWDIFNIKDYSHDNTFIIDDYDDVYKNQKENCIFAPPFEFKKTKNDTFLKDIVDVMKEKGNTIKEVVNAVNEKTGKGEVNIRSRGKRKRSKKSRE